MLLHCDRCKKKFEGEWTDTTTYGCYDVSSGSWARFARPYETLICDACMWADPAYIDIYGLNR